MVECVRAGSGEAGDLVSPPANCETSRRQALFNRNFNDPRRATPRAGDGDGGRGDALASFPVDTAISSSLFSFLGFEKTGQDAHRTPLIVGSLCLFASSSSGVSQPLGDSWGLTW